MKRRRWRRKWPPMALEKIGDRPMSVRAGYVMAGRYVAICACNQPIFFKRDEQLVPCKDCSRTYAPRKVVIE